MSGNTKKIADAMRDQLTSEGHQVVEKDPVELSPSALQDYDLIFLGSACHDADLAEPVIQLLEKIDHVPNSKLAGFVTHATTMPDETVRNQQLYTRWAGKCIETFERFSAEKGFNLLGFFHCQGAPIPPIAEFIHNEIIPEEQEWEEYFHEVEQHPNKEDLENASTFARDIIRKVEETYSV